MRFRRYWWLYIILLFFVFLLTIAGLRQSIGRFILNRILFSLKKSLNAEVTYSALGGDIWTAPRLTDVRVVFDGDSVFLSELSVRYDILALLQRKIVFSEIRARGLQVFINGGKVMLQQERRLQPSFPDLTVRRLELTDGQLVLNGVNRIDSARVLLSLFSSPAGLNIAIDSLRGRLVQENIAVRHIGGQVAFSADSLRVAGFKVVTRSSRLRGDLAVEFRTGGVAVALSELSVNMEEFLSLPGRLEVTGQATKEGKEMQVDVGWEAEGLLWRNIRLPRLSGGLQVDDSLAEVVFSGGDTVLGSFYIAGRININDYRLTAFTRVESLAVGRLEEKLPEFRISAEIQLGGVLGSLADILKKGEVTRPVDSVSLEIVKGSVRELGADSIFAVMNYRSGRVQLRRLTLKGPAGDFNFIGVAGEGLLRASCAMENFDLGVIDRFLNAGISGRAMGNFNLIWERDSWAFSGAVFFNGFSAGNKIEVTEGIVSAELIGVGNSHPEPFRNVSGRLAIGGEGVKFAGQEWNAAQFVWTGPEFDIRLERGEERLSLMGDVFLTGEGGEGLIKTLVVITPEETVVGVNPAQLFWGADSLTLSGLKVLIAGGEAGLDLKLAGSATPELDFYARHLDLTKLQRFLAAVFPELSLPGIRGVFDLDLTGSDTMTLTFAGTDFGISELELEFKSISGKVMAGRSWALLERVDFVHRHDTSSVSGEFSFNLADGLRINEVELDMRLADPGIALFMVTRPYVEIKDGLVYGSGRVQWQEDLLKFSGRVRVSQGVMTVPAVATTVERIEADLTLREDKIFLEKMSGRSARGAVTAEGIIDLDESLALDSILFRTHFNGVSAVPIPGVYAIGGGDINISWRDGEPRAFISGATEIEEALVVMGFGQSGGSGGGDEGVDFDIRVQGSRGIWLRNRDMDIEMGGDLTVRQVGKEAVYTGELVCRQGSVYYLDHILRVKEGKLVFANISSFNPQLDITAELPIVRNGKNNTPERLILNLTGTFAEPTFKFYSEPSIWDETQIISYLGLNVTMDEISAMEQKELLNRMLTERVLGYFETQVAKKVREFVRLDYLELETGILSGTGAKVTVGKYIGRNIYISYTQSFAGHLEPAFQVEYYLNRRNELLAQRSPDGRYSFRYRFKIRY